MDKYTEKIGPYLEEALSEAETAELEAHLATCPVCQFEHVALKRIDQLFANAPLLPPPANFTARFEVRLDRRLNRRRTWVGVLVIGLALSLAAGLLAWSVADSSLLAFDVLSRLSLLENVITLFGAVAAGLGTLVKVGALIFSAMSYVVRHPAFWGLVAVTGGMVSLWAQIVRRFVPVPQPVRA